MRTVRRRPHERSGSMKREAKPKTKALLTMLVTVSEGGREVFRKETTYGVCQKCGCTDFNCEQCVRKTGKPCSWVNKEHTLCSACSPATSARPGLRIARGGA